MSMNIRRCSGVCGASALRYASAPRVSQPSIAGSISSVMLTIRRRRSASSSRTRLDHALETNSSSACPAPRLLPAKWSRRCERFVSSRGEIGHVGPLTCEFDQSPDVGILANGEAEDPLHQKDYTEDWSTLCLAPDNYFVAELTMCGASTMT
ncbi:hypothetical protein [Saccharopolyspora sp. NPDC049426]|uniref:hypothetical protein n=1 Tax=Saccharopolyspora sp. NPDC049426 TaxID=3155652 RepID=UPI00343019E7